MRARTPLVFIALLAAAVGTPAAARATIVASGISAAPAGGFYDADLGALSPFNAMQVSGSVTYDTPTASGTTSVGCVSLDPLGNVSVDNLGDLATDSGGAFSGSFTLQSARDCRLAALPGPGPFSAGALGPFGGPIITGTFRRTQKISGGPNAGEVTLSDFQTHSTAANATIGDPARGTPLDMSPSSGVGSLPVHHQPLWGGDGVVAEAGALGTTTRSAVMVDGAKTVTGPEAAATDDTIPGIKGLQLGMLLGNGGDIRMAVTMPLLRCPSPCTAYTSSGVELQRDAATTSAGRVMTVTDTWHSTDGKPHDLDVLLQYEQAGGGPSGEDAYSMSWIDGGAYKTYVSGGIVPSPPDQVSSILVRRTPADLNDTHGSMTLTARPDRIRFSTGNAFDLTFRRSLPAGGSIDIVTTYSVGLTDGDATSAAAAAEVAAKTTAVPAASPPAAPPPGTPPTVVSAGALFGARPAFKHGVLTVTLGCQGRPGQSCVIGALLTAPAVKAKSAKKQRTATLLRRSLTIPVGSPRPVKLRLSKQAVARIPRRGSLAAQLVLTQSGAGAPASKRYKIKLRR